MQAQTALRRVLAHVTAHRDVIAGRVRGPEAPDWCVRRGWAGLLLGLDAGELERCEREGLAAARALTAASPTLHALCEAVDALCAFPMFDVPPVDPLHRAGARKRVQVAGLLAALRSRREGIQRIVDVGAGHGHLTRTLAGQLGIAALGLERDPERVRVAASLGEDAPVHFEAADVLDGPLPLRPRDLLVGLHACGELGDVMVARSGEQGASILLVSCCHQKRRGAGRSALSSAGQAEGFEIPAAQLGLANAGAWAPTRELWARSVASRRDRYVAGGGCAEDYERIRRLSLPRIMLGRLLEVAILLDRAAYLEERAYDVELACAFPVAASPRNLMLYASPQRRRAL